MIDTNALQKYSLFGGVLPDQIERIKPLFGYARYDAGDMPMREGDPNDKIFFIIGGRVMDRLRRCRYPDGRRGGHQGTVLQLRAGDRKSVV